ncbi:MAG: flagellar biosynthesis protein FlhA [Planctomycetota bacterium]|nr:flagellar biosynthesis protein FlhA [Planctomycetota bacterium]
MTTMPSNSALMTIAERVSRWRHMLVPLAILMLLGVLVVPLSPVLLDILLATNIALAAIILLTTVYMRRALDFSAFPAILLGVTLMRLVLNVASTRLILNADSPTPEGAMLVAGRVIESFGTFVVGSSIVVGIIIFVILVVVQFVVITKGATRMSEVAARFTLDAMPGKQMAIDADLSAGLIDENEARRRRDTVTEEADFYGAMDGASKFVRGDAIAGIIITLVNILGGVAIGLFMKNWDFSETVSVFTTLTIGDGLASQIPAFIIAIAAGLIVARTGDTETIGEEVPRQLASQPKALYLVAGFLIVLSLTPLPTMPLLIAALLIGTIAWAVQRHRTEFQQRETESLAREAEQATPGEAQAEDLVTVDVLEIEIGYGLVPLVDAGRGGDLLDRIAAVRRQLAVELGVVVPPVRIRDNVQLDANRYQVRLRGALLAGGVVYPDLVMAMNSGDATEPLEGVSGREPAFGLEVTWIHPDGQSRAEMLHYTIVNASSVLATHFTELVREHAADLVSREEVCRLIDQLKTTSPKLVEETVPAVVKPAEVQRVLHNLLRERIPVRDLETILETMGDWAPQSRDPSVLTEYVRNALRRTISQLHARTDEAGQLRIYCVTLDPDVEERLSGHIERGPVGTTLTMPPATIQELVVSVASTVEGLVGRGYHPVVITSPVVRAQLWQILESRIPGIVVLAYNEIEKGIDVESLGLVQMQPDQAVALGAA